MNIQGDVISSSILRRWLAHLLLLVVVIRALIPIGYMPDFSAAADGVFKVVICSAYGAKTIALSADGTPEPDQQSSHHDQPCAFAGLGAVALPALVATALAPLEFIVSTLTPPIAVQLPPSRAGPMLGSRGPPQFS